MGAWLADRSGAEWLILGGLALIALGLALDVLAHRRHHEWAARLRFFGGLGVFIGVLGPWSSHTGQLIARFVLAPAACLAVLGSVAVHARERLRSSVLLDLGRGGALPDVDTRAGISLLLCISFVALLSLPPTVPRFERVTVALVMLVVPLCMLFLRSVVTEAGIVQFPFVIRWGRIRSYEWTDPANVELTLRRPILGLRSLTVSVPADHHASVTALLAERV